MLWLIHISRTDAINALEDPLNYGARELSKANNKQVQCSCNLISDKPAPTLWFDGYNKSVKYPYKEPKEIIIPNLTFSVG